MDFAMLSLEAATTGEAVDAVIEVTAVHEGFVTAKEKWFGTECRVHEVLTPGTWTLYGYRTVVSGDIILEPGVMSKKFRKPCMTDVSQLQLREVCAGIGGFSLGAAESGFKTVVFLDRSPIACQTIRNNGGTCICADIGTREARIALHEAQPEIASLLTAGFPCQPFSRQGDGRGFQDNRAHTLTHILITTWFLQPEGLVLECVVEAEQNPDVRAQLAAMASKLGWQQQHMGGRVVGCVGGASLFRRVSLFGFRLGQERRPRCASEMSSVSGPSGARKQNSSWSGRGTLWKHAISLTLF